MKKNSYILVSLLLLLALPTAAMAANKFKSPDILVLGDSQFTFGSGPSFLDFFQNIKSKCSPNASQSADLKKLADMSVAVIGVRSSSLTSWTARTKKGKGAICDIDPKWKVNAGSYGTVNQTKNIYIQIGKGPQYQFCKKKMSPFEALFVDNYYDPKLLVMSFLGNSSAGWAKYPDMAMNDVQKTMSQLPDDLPCIFMTTAPSYSKETNDLRVRAQKNLKKAWINREADLPYDTPYDALIMASIVEKETGKASERPQIAGVFVRRLQKGMKLQTDPTVIYGIGDKYDGNIRRRDLRRDTPYNTYTRKGMPPTPIAMPGLAAIEAALHPADGTALYFVAKGDGSHVFSTTLQQHNEAVIKYQLKGKRKAFSSNPIKKNKNDN